MLVHRKPLVHTMRMAPLDYMQRLQKRAWSWTWDPDAESPITAGTFSRITRPTTAGSTL
jgi:hypothetical protein